MLVVQATNHHNIQAVDMVVVLALSLAELLVLVDHLINQHQAPKYNSMPLMLKVSSLTKTHKSSAVQLLVVFKHTHKISKFDSFNHHPSHLQA